MRAKGVGRNEVDGGADALVRGALAVANPPAIAKAEIREISRLLEFQQNIPKRRRITKSVQLRDAG